MKHHNSAGGGACSFFFETGLFLFGWGGWRGGGVGAGPRRLAALVVESAQRARTRLSPPRVPPPPPVLRRRGLIFAQRPLGASGRWQRWCREIRARQSGPGTAAGRAGPTRWGLACRPGARVAPGLVPGPGLWPVAIIQAMCRWGGALPARLQAMPRNGAHRRTRLLCGAIA